MVSLEIPYYPCLFGQTKSVPGIKYRILGDGENNYYESFKSVIYHPLHYYCCIHFSQPPPFGGDSGHGGTACHWLEAVIILYTPDKKLRIAPVACFTIDRLKV